MRLTKNNFFDNNDYERMPVLFCIFAKTETSKKVFKAIKRAKPKKLYVSGDHWRENKEGEREKVEELRKFVLENIDWDCEVYTKFNEKNHGSGKAMEASIDWFFENEEMGIILEDDCLPAPSFFRFCSELLQKYKDDERVFLVNGTNEGAKALSANTYSFKRIYDFPEDVSQLWGWASWRRAWKKHDKKLAQLKTYKQQCKTGEETADFDEYLKNSRIKVLANQAELILEGKNNTWDLKFKFSVLTNDGLVIVPDSNLVCNIGCGVLEVAHTAFEFQVGATLVTGEFLFPIKHPSCVSPKTPLGPKEFLRAAYMPISIEKDFWDREAEITDEILNAHNFLAIQTIEPKQKVEMYRNFLGKKLFDMISVCVSGDETCKARKYLYLALAKSALYGEENICAKCGNRRCLSVCPNKSVSSFCRENGETAVKIDRKTCDYCFSCVGACPVVNKSS